MNAALKLIDTADKLARRRPDRLPSQKQSEVTANLSLISRTWRTLTQTQRDGFSAFGQTWSPNRSKKSTASGFTVFQSLNGVRLNAGQTAILTDAPAQPDFIGKLPAFRVTATLPAQAAPGLTLTPAKTDAPSPDAAAFSLVVASPPFLGPVLVLATRPLSAGTGQPSPRLFRQVASLPAFLGNIDLADAYLTQFPAPALGMKVAVQIVPVTPNGFRGNPFTQTATVQAP